MGALPWLVLGWALLQGGGSSGSHTATAPANPPPSTNNSGAASDVAVVTAGVLSVVQLFEKYLVGDKKSP